MSVIDTRNEHMFPKLSPEEIDRLRRFDEIRHYTSGERLVVTGEISPGMFVIISGAVAVRRRDPLGYIAPIVERGPGDFIAEVGQLSGQPALVDVYAINEVEAILIPTENLRALLIEEPELGDRIMRALILRRVALIETGSGGPVLIGPVSSPDMVRLQGFLARNDYPHQVLDPARDWDAATIIERYAPDAKDLPLAICPNGSVLKNPSEADLARALGMLRIDDPDRTFDVAVVGAGPAGPLDCRLCCIRGPLGDRLRCDSLWRASRSERPDRELSWIPDRYFWPCPHGPGLRAGSEVWGRDGHPRRNREPRLCREPICIEIGRGLSDTRPHSCSGQRCSLPAARSSKLSGAGGPRHLVLGLAH
jgi:CRP-like cAMP-binding protein